jgi:hypothetical protein
MHHVSCKDCMCLSGRDAIGSCLMRHCFGRVLVKVLILLSIVLVNGTHASELKVEIRSPREGLEIRNEQNYILIRGESYDQTCGTSVCRYLSCP